MWNQNPPGGEPFDEAVREAVEEAFSRDVTVNVYENRGKLDVRVEPDGITETLEGEFEGVDVVPYGEFKLIVTDEDD